MPQGAINTEGRNKRKGKLTNAAYLRRYGQTLACPFWKGKLDVSQLPANGATIRLLQLPRRTAATLLLPSVQTHVHGHSRQATRRHEDGLRKGRADYRHDLRGCRHPSR